MLALPPNIRTAGSTVAACPPFTPNLFIKLRRALPASLFLPHWLRIPPALLGRTGAALTALLSTVLSLLLSHTYSTALSRWTQGKKAWNDLRREIRDGTRWLSLIARSDEQDSVGEKERNVEGAPLEVEMQALMVAFVYSVQ